MTLNRDRIIQIALNMFTKLAEIISATCTCIMPAAHGVHPDRTDASTQPPQWLNRTRRYTHTRTRARPCRPAHRERGSHAEIGNDSSQPASLIDIHRSVPSITSYVKRDLIPG